MIKPNGAKMDIKALQKTAEAYVKGTMDDEAFIRLVKQFIGKLEPSAYDELALHILTWRES